MTRGEQKLIDRLREGPFALTDYQDIGAASMDSVKVRISLLRKKGYKIITLRQETSLSPRTGVYCLQDNLPPIT